jgi:hypothetical protein
MGHKTVVRAIASIVLACLSLGVISLIDALPYSHSRDVISDSLKAPAYLIAGTLAPEGIHGKHPMLWLYSGIVALPITYAVVWFAVLALFGKRKKAL